MISRKSLAVLLIVSVLLQGSYAWHHHGDGDGCDKNRDDDGGESDSSNDYSDENSSSSYDGMGVAAIAGTISGGGVLVMLALILSCCCIVGLACVVCCPIMVLSCVRRLCKRTKNSRGSNKRCARCNGTSRIYDNMEAGMAPPPFVNVGQRVHPTPSIPYNIQFPQENNPKLQPQPPAQFSLAPMYQASAPAPGWTVNVNIDPSVVPMAGIHPPAGYHAVPPVTNQVLSAYQGQPFDDANAGLTYPELPPIQGEK